MTLYIIILLIYILFIDNDFNDFSHYGLANMEEFYLQRICLYSGVTAGQQPLSIIWLLRRSFIFKEIVYTLASLRQTIFYILAIFYILYSILSIF